MLSLLAFCVCTTSAYALTCHCLNGSQCDTNGFCVQGCEKGWHGPGCQIGNAALGKAAKQSTTYTDSGYACRAENAVDGSVPSDTTAWSCSHTQPHLQTAWWVVTLSTTHDYVISNVTLVNRKGFYSSRLANFVILYSNETNSDPSLTDSTWQEFAQENGMVGNNQTYTCNKTVIAKRVAVHLKGSSRYNNGMLTLCEVQIYGYELHDCPSGFTGPGCLLRACDKCALTGGNCAGDFNNCRYSVCPDDSLLPPDCWITLSNLSGLSIRSTATCNSVRFSAVLRDSKPNIAATSLQLQVTKSSHLQVLVNATLSLKSFNSVYYTFSTAAAETWYNTSVKLQYCDSTGISCFHSPRTKVFTVLTGKREYIVSQNDSCIFVSVGSLTPECELPSAIQVTCESEDSDKIAVTSSSSSVCHFQKDRGYNCSIAAIIDANTTERQRTYVVMGPPTSSPRLQYDSTVLTGLIGGLVAIIVVVATIINIVYYRRRRISKSQASLPPDAADEIRLASSKQKRCNNPYQSAESDYVNVNYYPEEH